MSKEKVKNPDPQFSNLTSEGNNFLDDLQKDLNELQVNKKTHIQIEKIIQHYKNRMSANVNGKDESN